MRISGVVACAALVFAGAGTAVAAEDNQAAAIQQLLDKAEIEALVARYVTALDTLDADAYEGVFTEDGEAT